MALLRTGLQLVVLGVLYAGCQWLVARTKIPVPPGLLALLVLIGLLLSRVVPERAVDRGGDLLLKYLPVPPGLLALVLLLGALLLRVLPEGAVAEGGDLILKVLGALFVPPGIALVRQFGLLRAHGVALVITLLTALLVGQIIAGKVASHWTRESAR